MGKNVSVTMDVKGLHDLSKKYASIAEEFKAFAIMELDKAVKKMEVEAQKKSSPSKLKRIFPNSTYERTGNLSRSIYSTPYQNGYATIGMGKGITYAPYVEFGTRRGYGMPYQASSLIKGTAQNIAIVYKGNNIRKFNMQARPFFFNTINTNMNALYRKLNSYKPKV
jgi:HK97 gp10 family phage protein